jgi:rhodanese-related sulfurtransferase
MPGPNQMTPAQLMRLIGTPEMPMIVDVRIPDDFAAHPFLIPTAHSQSHNTVEDLVPALSGHKVVVVCQRGLRRCYGRLALRQRR